MQFQWRVQRFIFIFQKTGTKIHTKKYHQIPKKNLKIKPK